jgi:hypothetical protein
MTCDIWLKAWLDMQPSAANAKSGGVTTGAESHTAKNDSIKNLNKLASSKNKQGEASFGHGGVWGASGPISPADPLALITRVG